MILTIFILVILSLSFIGFMWYKAYHDNIDYRTITLNNSNIQNNNLRLFFISDIHKRIIKKSTINEIGKPIDLVIIGGDLVERGVDLLNVKKNIQLLHSFHAPIYFIWGNNDYEVNRIELKNFLENMGVIVLSNETINLQHGNAIYSFTAVDFCNDCEPPIVSSFNNAIGDYSILLTHDPSHFYNYMDKLPREVDLVLSGHTHGGQIRVFGFGLYTRGGFKVFSGIPILISEGYGFTKLPFRLGTNAECHVISVE